MKQYSLRVLEVERVETTSKIIGISGGSGAGKTTLAKALVEHMKGEVLLISYDRYYKTMPCGNYDLPEALDTVLFLQHLHQLLAGHAVDLPIYDRINNQRTSQVETVEPKPLIVVEGIFALHHPELHNLFHLKVYVETVDDSLRLSRRIERDIKTRGDTEQAVKEVWVSNVLPVHYELIQPQCDRADLVVSGEDSVDACVSKVLEFL